MISLIKRSPLHHCSLILLFGIIFLVFSACGGGGGGLGPDPAAGYTVTFDTNGGTPVPAKQTVPAGGTVTSPVSVTKAGSGFSGWYSDKAYTKIWDFQNDTVTGNLTLYARWSSGSTYTVIYNANGGIGNMGNTVFTAGASYNLTPNAYTYDGYNFLDWNTQKNGLGARYKNGESVTDLTAAGGTVTLYAKWSTHKMVWISAGTFQMGSPSSEPERNANREDRHQVTLSKGFYMGVYEVRQSEYKAVMNGASPSSHVGNNYPVEQVRWYDALVFCNNLSIEEGLTPVYTISGSTSPGSWGTVPTASNATWDAVTINSGANGYCLPTEAEWEYACRARSSSYPFSTGNVLTTNQANYNGFYPYNFPVNLVGTFRNTTTGVGSLGYKNGFGLYDMHGNVYEWCWDWNMDHLGSGAQTDPTGPGTGTSRIIRGGSWNVGQVDVRSAHRIASNPSTKNSYIGFRVVRP